MAGDHTGQGRGELFASEPPVVVHDDMGSEFEVVRRGYDPRQVEARLGRLDAELRILVADRDAAVEQAGQLSRELDECRARAERLRTQVRSLVTPPTSVPGMSERMRSMLRLAEDEVRDMLMQAEVEAARRHDDAEQEAAEIRASARAAAEQSAAEDAARRAELEAQCAATAEAMAEDRRRLTAELAAEQSTSLARIAQVEEEARRRHAEAQAAWEERQAQIEEDFALAMDQRRAAAIAELEAGRTETFRRNAELVAAAQEQSRRTIAIAEEHAQRVVDQAQLRVAILAAARERVASQLAESRAILRDAVGALAARPEHPDIEPGGAAPEATDAPTPAGATGGRAPAADAGSGSGGGAPRVSEPTGTEPTGTADTDTGPTASEPAGTEPTGTEPTGAGPAAGNGRPPRWGRPSPSPR